MSFHVLSVLPSSTNMISQDNSREDNTFSSSVHSLNRLPRSL
jgi:hypothetical protein